MLTGNSLLNCKELTLLVICVQISWGKKSVQWAFIEMFKGVQCPFMVTISPQCQSITRLYIMEIKTHINTHINVKMLRAVITHTFIFNWYYQCFVLFLNYDSAVLRPRYQNSSCILMVVMVIRIYTLVRIHKTERTWKSQFYSLNFKLTKENSKICCDSNTM